jgi:hypothetical protein
MKRGTPSHPKLLKFARALNIPAAHAGGLLEFLWHWASKYAIQGDIGRWSDADIAAGSGWEDSGRVPEFIGKLLESGWLDADPVHRLLIHDWADHADDSVRKTLKNRGLEIFRNVSGKVPNDSEQVTPALAFPVLSSPSLSSPLPKPEASPSESWERFEREYPGEVVPDRDCRVYLSVINAEADEALLFENLPAWKATRKFRDGFAPSAQKFLFEGHWKVKPKPDPVKQSSSDRMKEEMRAIRTTGQRVL